MILHNFISGNGKFAIQRMNLQTVQIVLSFSIEFISHQDMTCKQ